MYIFNFQDLPSEVDFPDMKVLGKVLLLLLLLLLLSLLLLLFTLNLRFIQKFAYTGLEKLPGFDNTFEYASSY